jgi:16S rRNA processing protein RimM
MSSSPSPTDLILVGVLQKPYGLLGEIKVKPETFDFERHARLTQVYCRKRHGKDIEMLTVRATRADDRYWYLKFEDLKTPEAVAHLSGCELCVDAKERLELPEGMVYFSDLPGMSVIDERGENAGTVIEVMETGSLEYILIRTPRGEIPVPWNDQFVKSIDAKTKIVTLDLSTLRGSLL